MAGTTDAVEEQIMYAMGEETGAGVSASCKEAVWEALVKNHAVGFLMGYYKEGLPISYVSSFLLHTMGYSFEEFSELSRGSLPQVFFGTYNFFAPETFRALQGDAEATLLTKDQIPLVAHLYKNDAVDQSGKPMWVMTVQVDWMRQNLDLVTHVMHTGFWYSDYEDKKRVIFSDDFRKMLGYKDAADFPNLLSSWSDRIHPSDRERVVSLFDTSEQPGENSFQAEYRLQGADGVYRWYRDSWEVLRTIDGMPRRMVGIIANIEDERAAKDSARRNAAFHRVYTGNNLCEYYVNLSEHRFVSLKKEGSLLRDCEKGASWEELIACYIRDYVCEDDKAAMASLFDEKYLERQFTQGQNELSLECRICVDGEMRWAQNVLIRDEAAEGLSVIVFIRDITGAKEEAARIQELSHVRSDMDLLIEGTVKLVNRYATCDIVNDTYNFYKLKEDIGCAPSGAYHDFADFLCATFKLIGDEKQSLAEIITPAHLQRVLQKPEDVFRFEYATHDESQYKTLSITPLQWENGVLQKVIFIAQDITDEKQVELASRKALVEAYENANRANRAKTDFLSNMSHDIRTPMNAIVGMTAIAGANIDNKDRVMDCLAKITQASRHLLGLINEVLDMSRIESGKISLNEEAFNLSELMDDVISMNRTGITEHHHQLEVRVSKITHENVIGDGLRIQQLITNIMSNSIKYTPDGGKITFDIREIPTQSQDVGCYEFIIEDNGIGMSEEFQEIMFEPFSRADDKRTSQVQGTGLGMAIARNIAQMMNGNITVDSALGRGSKFTITISLKLDRTNDEDLDHWVGLPVLVVDDDILCCQSTVEILQDIGIDSEWVTSGEAAIEKTLALREQNGNYFAIIIDWHMPGMDGIETTRRLRRIVGPDVTIIILSGYDFSSIEAEAREAGVNDFITKPLFRSRLISALQSNCCRKKAAAKLMETAGLAKMDLSGKRILLVEDNALNREIAEELLAMTGVTVDSAVHGKEGVEKFITAPAGYYDLIFMDIQMPVMNGYEAARAIRGSTAADAKTIPILAMTANAFAEDALLAKKAGMNEHIAKPLDLEKLTAALRQWIR